MIDDKIVEIIWKKFIHKEDIYIDSDYLCELLDYKSKHENKVKYEVSHLKRDL